MSCFCAIDLNQIKVTFTKEVDKATAETVSNYEVGGAVLTSVDKIELQADKKTVIINLGGTPKAQYAKAAFKVKGSVVYSESKIETVPVYTAELTFVDTQVPTVKSVTASGNKKIVVEFSEPVTILVNNATDGIVTSGGTKFKLDGQYVTNYGFTQAVAKNVATATGPIYYTNKIELEFATAITAGTHTLTTLASDGSSFFQDAASFSLVETPVQFTVDSVVNAPKIVSIEAQDNGTIYVTYDRSMADNAFATNTYYVNDSSSALAGGSFKDGTDKKVVKLSATNVQVGANVLKITKNLVTDTYGNKLNATEDIRTAFTATADTTKPTVSSVTPITNTKVRVKFSEDVNSAYATNAVNYTVKNASGTKLTGFTVSGSADTYDINFGTALTGTNYSLTIKNIVDTAKTPNVMNEYTTTFNGVDDVKPEVVNLQAIKSSGTKKAVITFTEAMDVSTITNTANYLYKGGDGSTYNLPSGTTLTPSDDTKSVEITFPTSYTVEVTSSAVGTTQYYVQRLLVSNVKDAGGNVLKDVSSGLMPIVAAASGSEPAYVADTFKLSAVSGKVTAEFEMDQTITNLDYTDFTVAGQPANSGHMSGKKVVLEFTDTTASSGNIAVIKAAGIAADLDTASNNSTNAYGTPIATITNQVVYDDLMAPELLAITKGSTNTTINVVFSETIDKTILGLYTDDFTVQSAGTMLTIDSIATTTTGGIADNTLVLTLNRSVGAGDTIVKAASVVDIRDKKDAAGNYNVYVPTTQDKEGTTLNYAYAVAPSSVGIIAGTTGAVITHNVALPAAGATDTSGIVDWTATTKTDIKFNLTDTAGGTSTITVDDGLGGGPVSYTAANNYTIASGVTSLTFVVTTTQTNTPDAVRTFTIAVN